jgi:hypothetical protein
MEPTNEQATSGDDTKIEEIHQRCVRAYARYCTRSGCIFDQPAKGLSSLDGNIYTLRNVRGFLARYVVKQKVDKITVQLGTFPVE